MQQQYKKLEKNLIIIIIIIIKRAGADKSLARPTYRCSRTASIVSLESWFCSCAELQVFSCYWSQKETCQATRTISTISRRELSSTFFWYKARCRLKFTPFGQKHYRNIHKRMPSSKTGRTSFNVVIFHPCCASSWTTKNSDHPGDYW